MSLRHEIYCPNCGKRTKRVRLSENEEVYIDCDNCRLHTRIETQDEHGHLIKLTLPVREQGQYALEWEHLDKNDFHPLLTCPFCQHFPITFKVEKDSSGLLECAGKNCKRTFEIEYV